MDLWFFGTLKGGFRIDALKSPSMRFPILIDLVWSMLPLYTSGSVVHSNYMLQLFLPSTRDFMVCWRGLEIKNEGLKMRIFFWRLPFIMPQLMMIHGTRDVSRCYLTPRKVSWTLFTINSNTWTPIKVFCTTKHWKVLHGLNATPGFPGNVISPHLMLWFANFCHNTCRKDTIVLDQLNACLMICLTTGHLYTGVQGYSCSGGG